MATTSHSVQLPLRGSGEPIPVDAANSASFKPQLLPPELLLKVATCCERTEDLQNLRLVNRAFSKAATTALQDRFVRIYLLPTRNSMARFSKLTENKLIAPKITELVVLYRPPYASPVPPGCQIIAENYCMPWQKVKDNVSEYNDMCVDSVFGNLGMDNESPLQNMNVVESGEFEGVLEQGIRRLTALCSLSLRSDLDTPTESLPCLNLPDYLRFNLLEKNGDKYDMIQHLTVAEYARSKILFRMHMTCLGQGSPTYVLGALKHWASGHQGHCRSLKLLVSNMGSPCEYHWLKGLARRPRDLDDGLSNIKSIWLIVVGHRPSPRLTEGFNTAGEEFADLALGPHWCALLQAAVNLETLRLLDCSSWSAGFNNLLHHIFRDCTWSRLANLSIVRESSVKLLPVNPQTFDYSLSWYLFLQSDLDNFLLRHRATLETLQLFNIVGLDERATAPPLHLQYSGEGFPEDPTPSLSALEKSLKLWQQGLSKLEELEVALGVEFYNLDGNTTALDTWLRESEIQTLVAALGAETEKHDYFEEPLATGYSRVVFHLAHWMKGTPLRREPGSEIRSPLSTARECISSFFLDVDAGDSIAIP